MDFMYMFISFFFVHYQLLFISEAFALRLETQTLIKQLFCMLKAEEKKIALHQTTPI